MIRVVEHDPTWAAKYELEANRIANAVGAAFVRVHHIGSTAIPSTKAKPIIDVLLEVSSLAALDEKEAAMRALGYEVMGEFGIPGRRYFRLNDSDGTRTHQIHAFKAGSANVVRHLAFRDYMRAHPSIAYEYGELKARLALAHPDSMAAYMDGKDAFVKEHEARAIEWMSPDVFLPLMPGSHIAPY
jgi:GrpB-like predicted nucleotidyltransferase (UPF0157 family)